MGMDSYIYSFNRDDWNRKTALEKEKQELHREVDKRYKIVEEKYKWTKVSWDNIEKDCTEEEREYFVSSVKKLNELSDKIDGGDSRELMYWRKPFELHRFIRTNFLPEGEDDNCNHIVLSKEAIEKILQELKTNGVNYSEGCWDGGETEYAIELFTDILEKTDFETTVITYYSWY
jgi:hypothetical protein